MYPKENHRNFEFGHGHVGDGNPGGGYTAAWVELPNDFLPEFFKIIERKLDDGPGRAFVRVAFKDGQRILLVKFTSWSGSNGSTFKGEYHEGGEVNLSPEWEKFSSCRELSLRMFHPEDC